MVVLNLHLSTSGRVLRSERFVARIGRMVDRVLILLLSLMVLRLRLEHSETIICVVCRAGASGDNMLVR